MKGTVNILEGSTFVTSDECGDIHGTPTEPHGLFALDTRFLSTWRLTIDGVTPAALSTDDLRYNEAQFFLAPGTGTTYVDSPLSVIRRRSIADGMHEQISITNHTPDPRTIEVKIDIAADFADLFEVKDALEKKGQLYQRIEDDRLVLGYQRDQYVRETWVIVHSGDPEITEDAIRFSVALAPNSTWQTAIDVWPVVEGLTAQPRTGDQDGGLDSERASTIAGMTPAPRLSSDCRPIEVAYERSLQDLAALRLQLPNRPGVVVPAAGLPWFMSLFGRDSIITSYQALPFAPDLAAMTLRMLAELQGTRMDDFRDEEPGKIPHELRYGELTAFEERPHSPYYGAADSTTLWLILLDEYERWSGKVDLIRALEPNARAALNWIDEYGDRDGDGYIEYERRNQDTGLENQCWKDSWDAIRYASGRIAPLPRATCELQGYAYDAKMRSARLAREIWGDPAFADRLEDEAAQLKERFNRDFWLKEPGYFALALDGEKRLVDALTSNIGHLLWSGIVDDDKAARCVEHLMGERLFSGWGIRTMAIGDGGYNPIGYHVGTVWPHDNSIVAMGLARYGFRRDAARIAEAMLDAAAYFQGRLPEAFAGYPRELTHYPVEYPTACSPQAWATGAPLLFIRTMLGLEPSGALLDADAILPDSVDHLEVLGVPGRWGSVDVEADMRPLRREALAATVRQAPQSIQRLVAYLGEPQMAARLAHMRCSLGLDLLEASRWRLDIDGEVVGLSDEIDDADCILELREDTLLALMEGQQNPRTAVIAGKLKLRGNDLLLAHKIGRMLTRVDAESLGRETAAGATVSSSTP